MLGQILIAGMGAVIGSWARFGLLELAPKIFGKASSWMVMVINLSAALLMGITYSLSLTLPWHTFVASGIIGGYSTFSSPIVTLADGITVAGERRFVIFKTLLTFIGGIPVLLLGMWLGQL